MADGPDKTARVAKIDLTPMQKTLAWTANKVEMTGLSTFDKNSFTPAGAAEPVLFPDRQLLHEIITQAVTERRIAQFPDQMEKALGDTVAKVTELPAYKSLLERTATGGSFTRAEVSSLFDSLNIEQLPNAEAGKRLLMMTTGAPASFKSEMNKLANGMSMDRVSDGIKFNPDDFRPILADPEIYGTKYSAYSQAENKILGDNILNRIIENGNNGRRPHVIMDVVSPSEHRMKVAAQCDDLIAVTAVVPSELSVEAAYKRGLMKRQMPTDTVIDLQRWAAKKLPLIFENGDKLSFHMFDTNVPALNPNAPENSFPNLVAEFDRQQQQLRVHNPDVFTDFLDRMDINEKATSPSEFYKPNSRTPQRSMELLKSWMADDVPVAFMGEGDKPAVLFAKEGDKLTATVNEPLPSQRGEKFYEEMAKAANDDAAKAAPYKPSPRQISAISSAQAGFDGFALFMSGRGLIDAVEKNDKAGIALNGANVATSTASLSANAVSVMRGAEVSKTVSGTLGKANVALTLANIGVQVYKEEGTFLSRDEKGEVNGLGHKGERLVAATAEATPALVVAGATMTGLVTSTSVAGAGFAATAGAVGLTVVAPAVVIMGSAYVVSKATTTIIDTRRTYEAHDKQVEEMTRAGKLKTAKPEPSISNYKQCMFASARFSHLMRDSELGDNVKRNGPNAGNRITNFNEIDFSNPKAVAEFKRMLDTAEAQQRQIIKDNDSWKPRWLRSDDGILKQENAKTDLRMIESAKREVAMFEQEQAEYRKLQAQYQDALKAHNDAAKKMSDTFNNTEDLPARKSALQEFIAAQGGVQQKAEALPESPQRAQLLMESHANAASGHYSLATMADSAQEALASIDKAKEELKKAGLDPAREQSWKTIGVDFAEVQKREAFCRERAAAETPAPDAKTPDTARRREQALSG